MSCEVKITTICENRAARSGLLGEHGLAMLLETKGRRILFDTGAGATLPNNAAELGLDLTVLDAVILSHGHYDHTGGFKWVLGSQISATLSVYGHPDLLDGKYSSRNDGSLKYIGVPWRRVDMEALGARFHLERGPVDLGGGIMISGEIPRIPQARKTRSPFWVKKGENFVEDRLLDDQALIIESSAGLIVLLGCAHAGLIDTLQHILSLTGERRIYALLGGTHLLNTPPERLKEIVRALQHFGLELIAPCHCSGFRATAVIYEAFGEKCVPNDAGTIFELP